MFSEVNKHLPARSFTAPAAPFEDDKRGVVTMRKQKLFSTMLNPALVILERQRRISGGDRSNININFYQQT